MAKIDFLVRDGTGEEGRLTQSRNFEGVRADIQTGRCPEDDLCYRLIGNIPEIVCECPSPFRGNHSFDVPLITFYDTYPWGIDSGPHFLVDMNVLPAVSRDVLRPNCRTWRTGCDKAKADYEN